MPTTIRDCSLVIVYVCYFKLTVIKWQVSLYICERPTLQSQSY